MLRDAGHALPGGFDKQARGGPGRPPFRRTGAASLDGDVNDKLTSWKVPANAFTSQKAVTVRELQPQRRGSRLHGFPGHAPGAEIPSLSLSWTVESPPTPSLSG